MTCKQAVRIILNDVYNSSADFGWMLVTPALAGRD